MKPALGIINKVKQVNDWIIQIVEYIFTFLVIGKMVPVLLSIVTVECGAHNNVGRNFPDYR